MAVSLTVRIERWPIAGRFTISRGAKTEAIVVVAELTDGTARGRGESVPYPRYGETVEGVAAAGEAMRGDVGHGVGRLGPRSAQAAGARRGPPLLELPGPRSQGEGPCGAMPGRACRLGQR